MFQKGTRRSVIKHHTIKLNIYLLNLFLLQKKIQFTSIKRKIADKDDEIDSETEELNGINRSFKEYSDDEDTGRSIVDL